MKASIGTKPVLLVMHSEEFCGGCIPSILDELRIFYKVVRPKCGDVLPRVDEVASVIFFGGSNSANDRHLRWMIKEMLWMENALKKDLPMFNICLGAQMLAKVLGAKVEKLPNGKVECGYYPLTVSNNVLSKLKGLSQVYQWHSERFELPQNASCVATGSDICPVQGFEYGNALAVQFHPEISENCIDSWSSKCDSHYLDKENACPLELHYKQHRDFHMKNRMWLKSVILPWLRSRVER